MERQLVQKWLEIKEPLERQLEPLGEAVLSKLQLKCGERVLDLGCGIGATPLAIAAAVGPTGRVVGVEMLQPAIDVARAGNQPRNVTFVCGDAQTLPFKPGYFDSAFSRFGVMFFSEPVKAFLNIRAGLKSRGRIGFVCWRSLAENDLDALPLIAASGHLPKNLLNEAATAKCFSFATRASIHHALHDAGFTEIEIEARDIAVGTGDLNSTIEVCSRVGALGAILRQHPHFRTDVLPALQLRLRELDQPGGPQLRAAVWIVVARVR